MKLEYVDGKLSLVKDGQILTCDLTENKKRLKHNNLTHELLVKASKLKDKKPEECTVIDATAGFGEDSLLLAAAGFNVVLFERDETIAALLEDGLKRAALDPELEQVVGRMQLIKGDSISIMAKLADANKTHNEACELECNDSICGIKSGFAPDIILLDPMFPAREKSSLVKKKFQMIHELEKPCEEEAELLEAAKSLKPKRIVIKRPKKGALLAGVKPSYSIEGKTVRYDVIIVL